MKQLATKRAKNQTSFRKGRQSCNFHDETGNRFGKLVVVCREPNTDTGHTRWRCRCDCGGVVIRQMTSLRYAALNGVQSSCGCPVVERRADQSDKEYKRACHLMREYNMSEDDFDAYWFANRGRCFICMRNMIYPLAEN